MNTVNKTIKYLHVSLLNCINKCIIYVRASKNS